MPQPTKKTYHHGNLRESLLEAGEALLDQGGLDEFSLREVARQAGVSHAAPYRHFASKAELLDALVERGFGRLAQALRQALAAHPGDPRAQLLAAGMAYVQVALDHPALWRLMFGGLQAGDQRSAETRHVAEMAFAVLVRIIGGGIESRVFVNADPQAVAITVWSMLHGLTMLLTTGQLGEGGDGQVLSRLSRGCIEHLLSGVGAGSALPS